jgi:hypothetical protein
MLHRELIPIRKRLENLSERLVYWENELQTEADELAHTEPNINGYSIFETGQLGTVQKVYEDELVRADGTAGKWIAGQDKVARDVVKSWTGLAENLMPDVSPEFDMFLQPYQQSLGPAIPGAVTDTAFKVARQPFLRLLQKPVLDVWKTLPPPNDAKAVAQTVAQRAKPFLEVEFVGTTWRVLVAQGAESDRKALADIVTQQIGILGATLTSKDPTRAVVMQSRFRFALRDSHQVTGANGLHTAVGHKGNGFSRKDIPWIDVPVKLTPNQERIASILATALLSGDLRLEHNEIVTDVQDKDLSGKTIRLQLPFSLVKSMSLFESGGVDMAGHPTSGLLDNIELKVRVRRGDSGPDGFVRGLIESLEKKVAFQLPDSGRLRASAHYYVESDPELLAALCRVKEPAVESIRAMEQARPDGETSGYYCYKCPSPTRIGKDDTEARARGWRCPVMTEHYFGPRL